MTLGLPGRAVAVPDHDTHLLVEGNAAHLDMTASTDGVKIPSEQYINPWQTSPTLKYCPDVLEQHFSQADQNLEHSSNGTQPSYTLSDADSVGHSISLCNDEADDQPQPRGRTQERTGRVPDSFSRAESRGRANSGAIEINVHFMEPRLNRSTTFFKDLSNPAAELEDAILEPLAPGPILASVNEILEHDEYPVSSYQKRFSDTAFDQVYPDKGKSPESIRTRNSSAFTTKVHFKHTASSPGLNAQFMETHETDYLDAKRSSSIRASCPYVKSPVQQTSAALLLPAEIIRKIYLSLAPPDFNSARHACRSWYINSLEYSLLEIILRRGGWYTSIQRELLNNNSRDRRIRINNEWLMSKHLAKECALGPDWRGNGVSSIPSEKSPASSEAASRQSPFRLTSKIDFTNSGTHYPDSDFESSGMLFMVSACSKFLMVAHGCIVFVYELNRSHKTGKADEEIKSGELRPITSIICPRRVLACSMDTSSNRDAIAILMDGRMGLVCAVTGNSNRSGRAINMRDLRRIQDQPHVFPVSRGGSWRKNVSLGSSHSPRSYPAFADQHLRFSVLAPGPFGVSNSPEMGPDDGHLDYLYYPPLLRKPATYPTLMASSYTMPIEVSPPTLYALLCSADDPPRSVALCPQRRCVAFGCSSGIELHWVDALTSEDLNRWFPLTAPSDYLYFLPPRTGIDSAKKLRLVSSQGTPGERASVSERYSGRKKSSAFWGVHSDWDHSDMFVNTDIESETRGRIKNSSDHYRAIPLSDGYHLLFTDPISGVLCLGNDAPIGGPTKLFRKLWFSGPVGEGSPVAYAAASDLRWGVRIVAAYGLGMEQSIWLFSVPGDVFTDGYGKSEPYARNFPSAAGRETGRSNTDWMPWWEDNGGGLLEWDSLGYGGGMNMMWPVQVRGQEIGRCMDLVDLAVHTGPGIGVTIWAFSRRGIALTWKIDDGAPDQDVSQKWVARDGTVREQDCDGDIEMPDSDTFFPDSEASTSPHPQQEQFDGTASSLFPEIIRSPRRRRNSSSIEHDADGDVLMGGLPNSEPQGVDVDNGRGEYRMRRYAEYSSDASFDTVAMAHASGDNLYGHQESHRRDRSSLLRRDVQVQWESTDLLEELTGVARIDIEIR